MPSDSAPRRGFLGGGRRCRWCLKARKSLIGHGGEVGHRDLQTSGQSPQNAQCRLLGAPFHEGDVGAIKVNRSRKVFLGHTELQPSCLENAREGLNQLGVSAGAHPN